MLSIPVSYTVYSVSLSIDFPSHSSLACLHYLVDLLPHADMPRAPKAEVSNKRLPYSVVKDPSQSKETGKKEVYSYDKPLFLTVVLNVSKSRIVKGI